MTTAGQKVNSTSSTELVNHWNIGWTLAYSFVVLLVCVSNVLIMVAFTRNSLRSRRSSYQVINLSVADLAVGIIVMPLYMHAQMMNDLTPHSLIIHLLYFADPCFGLASFLILTIISCERLYAVAWPFKHRLLRKRHYAISLVIPWMIAAVDAAADGWPKAAWLPFPIYLVVLSLGLIVICSSYTAIWVKKTSGFQRETRHDKLSLKHKKLAKTLFITTIASLITWLPFYLYMVYVLACAECPSASHHLAFALKLLQFSNSFINGVIYSLRMHQFRGTIRGIFHRKLSRTIERLAGARPSDSAGENRGDTTNVTYL